jgi:hypothetical protein
MSLRADILEDERALALEERSIRATKSESEIRMSCSLYGLEVGIEGWARRRKYRRQDAVLDGCTQR